MEIDYYKPCPEYDRCCELIDRYWEAGEYEACFKGNVINLSPSFQSVKKRA